MADNTYKIVEILVARELGQEAAHLAVTRQRGHPEEDPPRLVVLGNRLERLHVLVRPETEHLTA